MILRLWFFLLTWTRSKPPPPLEFLHLSKIFWFFFWRLPLSNNGDLEQQPYYVPIQGQDQHLVSLCHLLSIQHHKLCGLGVCFCYNWVYWVLPVQHDCVPDQLYRDLAGGLRHQPGPEHGLAAGHGGHPQHLDNKKQEHCQENMSCTSSQMLRGWPKHLSSCWINQDLRQ